jgi:hypothetical protein
MRRATTIADNEWRRKVLPGYLGQAQEAVAQMRARGIPVEVRRGDWVVFETGFAGARAVEILDRVWPQWRDCLSD